MKREERQQLIVNLLVENKTVDLDDLADRFIVSKMTIHRDLDDLEQAGVLRKVRGGATIDAGTQFESDFRIRERQGHEAKVELVAPMDGRKRFQGVIAAVDGDTVHLDSEGTVFLLPLADVKSAKLILTDRLIAAVEQENAAAAALSGEADMPPNHV